MTDSRGYRQCKRCVMDTTDPQIVFDKRGYCNHCTNFLNKKSQLLYQKNISDKILEAIVQKIKNAGSNKKYDCVLGISGGTDSCYTALMCKNLGLRTLLVHLDNGWNTDTSVKNIEAVSKNLGFDCINYVLGWEEFKNLQLSFLKASVPEAETPTDIAILGVLHSMAAKYNVRYIMMGCNYATEGILPRSWHYDARDKKYLVSIQKKFGNKSLKTFPFFDYLQETYYKLIKRIKTIYLLNYIPYNKQTAIKELEKLGWKNYGQKHHESFYTRFIQSYVLYKKFNIDYRKAFLSTKICTEKITREEALQLLSEKPYDETKLQEDIQYVSQKLEISADKFNEIMKLPPKSFKDYPNNRRKLELIYKVYRFLKK